MRRIIFTYCLTLLLFCLSYQHSYSLSYEEIMGLSPSTLLSEGDRYMENNVQDSALVYFITLSNKYSAQLNEADKENVILGFMRAGDIYYEQSNYHNALDFYFKGFRICELNGMKKYLPEFYKNIGNIYNRFQDYEQGRSYYEKGLELAKEQGNLDMEVKLLNNLIGVCCHGTNEEDVKQAWRYYNQVTSLPLENDTLQKYYNLLDLVYIYGRENKVDSAVNYCKRAFDYSIETQLDPRYISSSATQLAILYEDMGLYNKALEYHLYSNAISQENQQIELLPYSLENLSVIYEKMGDVQKSLYYRNLSLSLSDSIFNIREYNRVKNSQAVYEMEKVNNRMDFLVTEKEQSEIKVMMQRRYLYLISGGLFLFVVLLIIVSNQKKKLQGAYVDLFERNKEIIESDKLNRKMRLEYEKRLKEEKEWSASVKSQLDAVLSVASPEVEELVDVVIDDKELELQKNTNLTDGQREKLISDINHIMENTLEFCDCDFSLNRLASLIGSNTKYVSQIINEVYHKNFRAYINEYRVKEASIRLMNTEEYGNYTIKAIAESVGYKSHTSFVQIFKKITGINPSTYQSIARNRQKQEV